MPRRRPSEKQRREEVERYNALFDQLCIDYANGTVDIYEKDTRKSKNTELLEGRKYSDWIKQPVSRTIVINGEEKVYFKMAFEENDNSIYRLCKRQLPRNWFVSRSGEILEYDDQDETWYWRKDSDYNKRLKQKILLQRKSNINDINESEKLYDKRYDVPKTKGLPLKETIDNTQLASYTLTSIVFNANVFGNTVKETIKKHGLLAFKQEYNIECHHTRGYKKDRKNESTYEKNMMLNNDPDRLMFLSKSVHDAIYALMITPSDSKEETSLKANLQSILQKENPDKYYMVILYPVNESGNDIPVEELKNYCIYTSNTRKDETKIQIVASEIPFLEIIELDASEFDNKVQNNKIRLTDNQKSVLQIKKAIERNNISIDKITIPILYKQKPFSIRLTYGNANDFYDLLIKIYDDEDYQNEFLKKALSILDNLSDNVSEGLLYIDDFSDKLIIAIIKTKGE